VSDERYSVCGSGYALTPRQKELLALVESLGPAFASRAARYDSEASFPFENYADLRKAGLLGLCVPESHGGKGADLKTYALVSATLGKYCGATALTFNMHACSTLWPGLLADDLDMTQDQRAEHERYRALHFRRVVEDGAVYAQPFSEGSAAAAGKAPFGTTAAKVDGGWVLNGRKIFASLSGAADFYGVLCTEAKPELSMRDTLYLAVPGKADGLTVTGDWDPLGMRGTVSRNLVFKDVFVPDEAAMMPDRKSVV
jgi:alkylation response protein AidB-like acyl-CoA dehydrogenase